LIFIADITFADYLATGCQPRHFAIFFAFRRRRFSPLSDATLFRPLSVRLPLFAFQRAAHSFLLLMFSQRYAIAFASPAFAD